MLAKIIIIRVKYLHCTQDQEDGRRQYTELLPRLSPIHLFRLPSFLPLSFLFLFLSTPHHTTHIAASAAGRRQCTYLSPHKRWIVIHRTKLLLLRETLICHCCRYNLNSNQLFHYFRLKCWPHARLRPRRTFSSRIPNQAAAAVQELYCHGKFLFLIVTRLIQFTLK